MIYPLIFLEGILTFISPCLLPMLPIYFAYLVGSGSSAEGDKKNNNLMVNVFGFVIGFTLVFMMLGLLTASFGAFINQHIKIFNIFGGLFIILLGLNFTGLINIPVLNRTKKIDIDFNVTGFFTSIAFGALFSIGWTPCVGAYLSVALVQAANGESFFVSMSLIFTYCVGLGIPFILSALFFNKLTFVFNFIKRHYRVINIVCGVFLMILGLSIMTGYYEKFLGLFRW